MELTRRIDNSLYSRKALADTREAYRPYCNVVVQPESSGSVSITVTVKGEYKAQARQVALEFWNYFLDTSCEQSLESV